jgi:hypothetical protein
MLEWGVGKGRGGATSCEEGAVLAEQSRAEQSSEGQRARQGAPDSGYSSGSTTRRGGTVYLPT